MTVTNKDIDDINFIIDEAIRLHKLWAESPEDFYKKEKYEDFNSMISIINPPRELMNKTNFQIFLSNEAIETRHSLMNRVVKKHKFYANGSDLTKYFDKELFYLIYKNKPNTRSNLNKLMVNLIKGFKKSISKETVYIPLNAVGLNDELNFGIVKVVPKEFAESKNLNMNQKKKISDIAEYEGFKFNSYISIPTTDISSKITPKAQQVANLVLGIIQVFIVNQREDSRFRPYTIFHKRVTKKNLQFNCVEGGETYLSGEIRFGGISDDFWVFLRGQLENDYGNMLKSLMDLAVNTDFENKLGDRLIDAFIWFIEASQEKEALMKIIKLTNALERLVTYPSDKNTQNIANNFSNRLTVIVKYGIFEINDVEQKAKKLYSLRSDIVHGSVSIFKKYDGRLDFNPNDFVADILINAVNFFGNIGFTKVNHEKKVVDCFNKILNEEC